MKYSFKRTAAFLLALTIVSGGVPALTGGTSILKSSISAEAASTATLSSGVLTLSGNVTKNAVQRFCDDTTVTKIVCEPGTVLPDSCESMFHRFKYVKEIDLSNASANLTNMRYMFGECADLKTVKFGSFDTSNVTDMSAMFYKCNELTSLDLSSFDTSNVTTMMAMFSGCASLEVLDVSKFNTSSVTNMTRMFDGCKAVEVLDVSRFNTSNVTDMYDMFNGCEAVKSLDLSSFDTSNVISIFAMFKGCAALKSLDLSSFNTSSVTDMSSMFEGCKTLGSLDLSSFDTSNVTSMVSMFEGCQTLESLDLSSFDTSNVKYMNHMFRNCKALRSLDLSNFNTSNVGSMTYMFSECSTLESLDLSNFNTSNVGSMTYMFSECSTLESLDLSSFDTSNVTNMARMFFGCTALESLDLSNFNTLNVIDMKSMFNGCSTLKSLDLSNFNTSSVTDMSYMFKGCAALESLDLSSFDNSSATNMANMFYGCAALKSLDLSNFVTSNVTNMANMFYGCAALESLDLSSFNTSSVTNMANMFYGCAALESLDLGSFNTSSVADMSYMFKGAALKSLDLSSFNTSSVTDMSYMFKGCAALESLDLSCFNTSSVTNMVDMFYGCAALKSLDLSGFSTLRTTKMSYMFKGCAALESLDLSSFNTSKVTSMDFMFDSCKALKSLDLSSFDTSKVENMSCMFMTCDKLKTIIVSPKWSTLTVTHSDYMFKDSPLLFGNNGTVYDSDYTDAEYARIDTPEQPGYLSLKTDTNIIAQPENYSGIIGSTAQFTVNAEGNGLTYQWQYNSGSGWKNSNMTGNKTATLKAPVTEGRNGLKFRCIIKDAYGQTLTSDDAVLIVTPKITKQSVDNSAAIGDTAKFTVTATGAGLTYQWQYDNGSGWKDSGMTGAKTSTLSVPVTEARNGQKYRCIINDANGKTLTSNAAVLIVTTKITKQPVDYSGAIGDTAKFTVTATGVGLTYQWQYDNGSGWKNSNVTGSKTNTLSVAVTEERNGLKYRCVIKDANGKTVNSDAVTLTVKAAVSAITAQPVDASGYVGDTAKFTVTATGAGLTYQWQYDNGSGWKDSGMTGAKTSTLSVPITEARNGQKYRCVIKDANGKSLTSNSAVLKVASKITKQPVDYSGAIGDTAKFTVTATGVGLTYQWQYDNGSGWKDSGMTGANTDTLSVPVTAARNGQKYRCVIKDANGKTLTSSTAILTVKK